MIDQFKLIYYYYYEFYYYCGVGPTQPSCVAQAISSNRGCGEKYIYINNNNPPTTNATDSLALPLLFSWRYACIMDIKKDSIKRNCSLFCIP